jgi:hypothetical protein
MENRNARNDTIRWLTVFLALEALLNPNPLFSATREASFHLAFPIFRFSAGRHGVNWRLLFACKLPGRHQKSEGGSPNETSQERNS